MWRGIPFGMVTGQSLFKLINELVGPTIGKNSTTLNEILETALPGGGRYDD